MWDPLPPSHPSGKLTAQPPLPAGAPAPGYSVVREEDPDVIELQAHYGPQQPTTSGAQQETGVREWCFASADSESLWELNLKC